MKLLNYTVLFEPLIEGGYLVIVPALPGIITYGTTLEQARAMALDAIKCHLEGLLKDNEPIPGDKEIELKPVGEMTNDQFLMSNQIPMSNDQMKNVVRVSDNSQSLQSKVCLYKLILPVEFKFILLYLLTIGFFTHPIRDV